MTKNPRMVAVCATGVALVSVVALVASLAVETARAQSRRAIHARSAQSTASRVCTSWYVDPGKNPGSTTSSLADVAAVSSSDIWAAGEYYNTSTGIYQTLVEHFDGQSWNVVPSPNAGDVNNSLAKIAVVSSNDIWAVGDSQSLRAYYSTLIEHWDGAAWSVIPSPNGVDPTVANNHLTGVVAVASDNVWAVGYYESANPPSAYNPLIEHWDGKSWTLVASPIVGSLVTVPTSVAAISATDVWVVGNYRNLGSSITEPLFENWNGTSWTVVPTTNTGWDDSEPQAVTAISANDIWAVGYGGLNGSSSYQSLTEHWNGTSWSVVSSPNVNGSPTFLLGASSLASNDVWAVGYYVVPSPIYREPVIMRWNGTVWGIVPTPNLGGYSDLSGISALSPSSIWAAGLVIPNTGQQNPPEQVLIESYNPRIAIACGTA